MLLGLMYHNLQEGNDGHVRMIRKVRERDMKNTVLYQRHNVERKM